jgi:hypothetical protein
MIGDPGCCATTGQAHDLGCPAVTKASFDLQRQFPKLSSQTELAHQVREQDLPIILKHDRRHKDGRPDEAVEIEAISHRVLIEIDALPPERCARSTSAAHRYANGWGHATDPPHKRARPRTVAAVRGPNSDTSRPHIRHNLWRAQARSFACSCATACDDFATASAVGTFVFIMRLTPALGRDGAQLRPISGASAPNRDVPLGAARVSTARQSVRKDAGEPDVSNRIAQVFEELRHDVARRAARHRRTARKDQIT